MSFLAAAVAAATLAGSLELRAAIVEGRYLQVDLVARGPIPVLLTPRTSLGCYVEVEIQDPSGQKVGWFGPRASCPTPVQSEYQLLWSRSDMGSQLFGVEIDILAPGRVRLVSEDGEVGDLDPSRQYRLVVTYHNHDSTFLTARTKRDLHRRYGDFSAPVVELRSAPISFRMPS